jgi:hypothetical protein
MSELSSLEETKKITQSYLLTKAKYDFSITEKRIFYRIIELLQFLYEGKSMNELKNSNFSINTDLFGRQTFIIPTSKVLNEHDNHTAVRKAFDSLMKKYISIEDDKRLEMFNLFQKAKYHKNTGLMEFVPTSEILLTFEYVAKNWKSYELAAAFRFTSIYSMRFFELFNNQKTPINYTIDEIKNWFNLENKYSVNADFFRYVIEVAQKELKSKAPIYFTYEKKKSPGSRSFTYVRFTVYENKKNIKKSPKMRDVEDYLPLDLIKYLKEEWYFTDSGMMNVIEDLVAANNVLKWERSVYEEIKGYAIKSRDRNLPGYLVSSIRSERENPTRGPIKKVYKAPSGINLFPKNSYNDSDT